MGSAVNFTMSEPAPACTEPCWLGQPSGTPQYRQAGPARGGAAWYRRQHRPHCQKGEATGLQRARASGQGQLLALRQSMQSQPRLERSDRQHSHALGISSSSSTRRCWSLKGKRAAWQTGSPQKAARPPVRPAAGARQAGERRPPHARQPQQQRWLWQHPAGPTACQEVPDTRSTAWLQGRFRCRLLSHTAWSHGSMCMHAWACSSQPVMTDIDRMRGAAPGSARGGTCLQEAAQVLQQRDGVQSVQAGLPLRARLGLLCCAWGLELAPPPVGASWQPLHMHTRLWKGACLAPMTGNAHRCSTWPAARPWCHRVCPRADHLQKQVAWPDSAGPEWASSF